MAEVLIIVLILSFLSSIFSMMQKFMPINIFQIIILVLTAYLLIRIRVKISRAEKEKLRAKIEDLEKKIESLGKKEV